MKNFILSILLIISLFTFGCTNNSDIATKNTVTINTETDDSLKNFSIAPNASIAGCSAEMADVVIKYLNERFGWNISDVGPCLLDSQNSYRSIYGYDHIYYEGRFLSLYVFKNETNDSMFISPWTEKGDQVPTILSSQIELLARRYYGNDYNYMNPKSYQIVWATYPDDTINHSYTLEVDYDIYIPQLEGFQSSTSIFFTMDNESTVALLTSAGYEYKYNFSKICPDKSCFVNISRAQASKIFKDWKQLDSYNIYLSDRLINNNNFWDINTGGYVGLVWVYQQTWQTQPGAPASDMGEREIAYLNPYTGELYPGSFS